MKDLKFVIVTGLSGAGKTQAIKTLEDLGFFCVDNLPPALIPKFAELFSQSPGNIKRVGLGIDIRGGDFFDSAVEALEELEETGFAYQILFLEADDETLVRRYKETRRRHPLAPQGRVLEGIREERRLLGELRGRAHRIIDTSNKSVHDFRQEIMGLFSGEQEVSRLIVSLVSFGFKHGLPLDADLVFDVRFLPNPHYVESLRDLDGNHHLVKDYVLKWPLSRKFTRRLFSLLDFLLPYYISEGKTQLTIAVGCTGGQHRSIVIVNRLGQFLKERGFTVVVEHRDVARREQGEDGR